MKLTTSTTQIHTLQFTSQLSSQSANSQSPKQRIGNYIQDSRQQNLNLPISQAFSKKKISEFKHDP